MKMYGTFSPFIPTKAFDFLRTLAAFDSDSVTVNLILDHGLCYSAVISILYLLTYSENQLPDEIFSIWKKFWKFQKRYILVLKFQTDSSSIRIFVKYRLQNDPFLIDLGLWIPDYEEPKILETYFFMVGIFFKTKKIWKISEKNFHPTFQTGYF